jgi:hypothetical protein
LLLEGFSHGAAGAGARERGAPQSLVFCGAKNAPRCGFEKALYTTLELLQKHLPASLFLIIFTETTGGLV